ncbi:unnamed protein product [Brachionus calyciflorus]|uniref:Alpha-(1,6)-fucosyltransferase n=1 Tax=Brachionus calyciflorus TaxID=104777 RepID=A0A813MR50_9BILA|nr:unnamed protein product [Brachionus calyciflorus]
MKQLLINFSIFFILIWFFGLWFILSSNKALIQIPKRDPDDHKQLLQLQNKIKEAENHLARLELKNKKNELVILNLKQQASKYLKNTNVANILNDITYPSEEFESLRRKIFNDVQDVSYFVNNQLQKLNRNSNLNDKIKFIQKNFQERINLLSVELENLSESDTLGDWRKVESENLAIKIQNEFHDLQNPSDCEKRKKIICDLNKSCGFGCQMHHVMYCFITSYFMNRTLILDSNDWRYNSHGYEAYFKPISKTCKTSKEKSTDWTGNQYETADVIRMPVIDEITNKPEFFPLAIPKKYLNSLSRFHGDPFVWWAGQILNYLMRFNTKFEELVQNVKKKLNFQAPCVGVHVRRTDKLGTEASFHALSEYMTHVKEFYDRYDLKTSIKNTRTVYLATDELEVMKEAKQNYPDYVFLMDETNAKTASLNQRYSPESAQGVILDIHFLSQCDFLVCTLSSQVCRMAYELIQTRYPDASLRFKSLDDVYYYGGQLRHNVIAVLDHEPNPGYGEIELKKGDLIGLAGNHWDGYSKGKNLRTLQEGLFPSYKIRNTIDSY